jgi:5-deoxy-glucuronate isomerase
MKLRQRPAEGPGVLVSTDPQRAGWRYLSFAVHRLQPGESFAGGEAGVEAAIVALTGAATLRAGGASRSFEGRASVFENLPWAAYAAPGDPWAIEAESVLDVAIATCPAEEGNPSRIVGPTDHPVEIRGGANATRQITHVFDPPFAAGRIMVVEVITPSGNWSSYPPHRHDGRGGSNYLEETYYYRIEPASTGYAYQRVYTGDTDLDEVVLARDGDLVLIPEGYHPVVAAPGANVYYLNALAGNVRDMSSPDDPDWKWVREDWTGRAVKLPIEPKP